ncbi:MerR family transcriptional regulator [Nocardia spumae]|uniref:MerR family transcriptional regulator n=1 Tax=Nocardia spumae TaxID=2887190 RepID=UPI001D152606|nr:MerR family transcriptional regulator [Nocardia spumae]
MTDQFAHNRPGLADAIGLESSAGAAVALFPVAEAARQVGIPVATLRSWNTRYGLGPAEHRAGRHRVYTAADVEVLRRMVELVHSGVAPSVAAAIVRGPVVVADVDSLLAAAFALDTRATIAQLSGHLRTEGVVATWEHLCRPALQRVADQQDAGRSCIEVEHFLSWCITAALHRIGAAGATRADVVLACTPGETHTLPLEAIRAALAARDVATEMLGADVPVGALSDAVARHAGTVAVLLWSQRESTGSAAAVRACAQAGATVCVAGPGWADVRLPDGVTVVGDLAEAQTLLTAGRSPRK